VSCRTEEKTARFDAQSRGEIEDSIVDRDGTLQNIVYCRPNISIWYSEDNMQSWSFQVKIDHGNPLAKLGECDREIRTNRAFPSSTFERLNRKYLR